jgi:hypothetical protein
MGRMAQLRREAAPKTVQSQAQFNGKQTALSTQGNCDETPNSGMNRAQAGKKMRARGANYPVNR